VVYLDIFKNTGLMTRITNALGVYLEFSRNLGPIEKHIARGSIRIFPEVHTYHCRISNYGLSGFSRILFLLCRIYIPVRV
jgi:hypothetical protein